MNTSSAIEPKRTVTNANASLLLVFGFSLALLSTRATFAADKPVGQEAKQNAPRSLDLSKVKIRIVDVAFVKELTGVNATYRQKNPDKYRAAILTLEVKKPAGESITIQAQDLALHYSYGSNADVSKCSGLSTFSSTKDVDRPMSLYAMGYGSVATGTATTKGDVVFIDVFFDTIEPDVSKLHLLVAQPIGASLETKGWQ